MSKREWIKIELLRFLLWLKTHMHPESLGRGDRRANPRRAADRRRDRFIRLWLLLLTLLWIWAAISLSQKQDQINKVAHDSVAQRCELTHLLVMIADKLVPDEAGPLDKNYQKCVDLQKKSKEVTK